MFLIEITLHKSKNNNDQVIYAVRRKCCSMSEFLDYLVSSQMVKIGQKYNLKKSRKCNKNHHFCLIRTYPSKKIHDRIIYNVRRKCCLVSEF